MESKDLRKIRVLSFVEASEVTGPAKNLIRFGALAARDSPIAEVALEFAAFSRGNLPVQSPFERAVVDAGLPLHVIRESFRFDPRVIGQIRDIIRRVKPDVVQTHAVKAHFLLAVLGLRRGCQWIGFHHGYTAENVKMLLYNQLNRYSLPRADRVVTVCTPFKTLLVGEGVSAERISVLGNSISGPPESTPEEVAQLRSRLNIGPGCPVVVSIGRQSKEKGHADLLEALRKVSEQAPHLDYRAVLVGDGPERSSLEVQAMNPLLKDKVIFAGYFAHIGPFYRLADIFALPSHSEGSPNVILEAMASGTPIVATSVGGIPDLVRDRESALLVPAKDTQALAAAILKLLLEPDRAAVLAARAKQHVQRNCTPEAYRDSLVGVYLSLLDLSAPAVSGE